MNTNYSFSIKDANNERSFNETAQSQVVNHSSMVSKKPKKKRSLFTMAKTRTIALYDRVAWLVPTPEGIIYEDKEIELFRKCLIKALYDMDGYNETAFKKDLAMHMAFLLNDRRFHITCWNAGWSLFKVSQRLAWCNATDFQKIRDLGIENVKGFDCRGFAVYEETDEGLMSELKALGFDKDYFENDPYSSHYKNAGGELKI